MARDDAASTDPASTDLDTDGSGGRSRVGVAAAVVLALLLLAGAVLGATGNGGAVRDLLAGGPAPPAPGVDETPGAQLRFGPDGSPGATPSGSGSPDGPSSASPSPGAPASAGQGAALPSPADLPPGVVRDPTAEDQLAGTAPPGGVLHVLRVLPGPGAEGEPAPVYLAVARSAAAHVPPLTTAAEDLVVDGVPAELRRGDGRRARELRWSDGPFAYRVWTSAADGPVLPDALLVRLAAGLDTGSG